MIGAVGDDGFGDQMISELMRWEQTYNNHIVITRGNQGVSYIKDETLHTVSAPKVEVVDTTGA